MEMNQKWNRGLVLYIIHWNSRLNTACSEIVKCSEIAKKNVEEMNQKRYKSYRYCNRNSIVIVCSDIV